MWYTIARPVSYRVTLCQVMPDRSAAVIDGMVGAPAQQAPTLDNMLAHT